MHGVNQMVIQGIHDNITSKGGRTRRRKTRLRKSSRNSRTKRKYH